MREVDMGWICCGFVVVCAILALAFVAFVLIPSTSRVDYDTLDCPRCTKPMRYRIKLPKKIRCSCGNIMPVPPPVPSKRTRDVSCPGCQVIVHVSPIHKPSRVRCRCGNIAEIP